MKTNNIINLEDFRTPGAKVFTGRDRGRLVRDESGIDIIAKKYPEVEVIIPDNIYSINPSFFEEFLFNVVNDLGREQFNAKFKFSSLGKYDFHRNLNEAVDRILRLKTALG
ncbi:MAG: STAS-like domain-containing protein [Janthinobacterium lividum]